MKPRGRVEWTPPRREALEALLASANGRRASRLMSFAQVELCIDAALHSELGHAWVSAGEAPDARGVTSICLCAVSGERLTVGVAAGHGAATPANAWADITAWDRYRDASNASLCRAWAGRVRPDRIALPLVAVSVNASSTATRDDLLAAVLADPDADAPRLVYADWLSERGDPRGAFIAMQCELAAGSSRAEALQAESDALLTSFGRQWLEGLRSELVRVRYRRGFVETAEVHDSGSLGELEPFFEREPVTALVFTSSRTIDGERFATLEWLERLRSVEFRAARPQAAGALSRERLAHVLGSRRLRRLSRLVLVGQRLGDEGLMLLASEGAKALPGLEKLCVEDDSIGERGVAPLAVSRWAGRFTELSLANNALGVEGTRALAESRSPGRLKHLDLGGNQVGNDGAFALARAERFSTLDTLSLPRNRITASGLEALLESRALAGLARLDLDANPIGAAGKRRLHARFG